MALPKGLWLPKIISWLAQLPRWATLIAGMIGLLKLLGGLLVGLLRSHAAREAEMAFLRQQLVVLKRSAPARLRLRTAESGVSHQSLGSAVSIGTTFGRHNR